MVRFTGMLCRTDMNKGGPNKNNFFAFSLLLLEVVCGIDIYGQV